MGISAIITRRKELANLNARMYQRTGHASAAGYIAARKIDMFQDEIDSIFSEFAYAHSWFVVVAGLHCVDVVVDSQKDAFPCSGCFRGSP